VHTCLLTEALMAGMSTEQLIMGSDPSEFHECQFWERFYATCGGKAFEWYGSWSDIAGLVLGVAERTDPLLVIGCGKYAGCRSAWLPSRECAFSDRRVCRLRCGAALL
jgi:hypothetical protein